MRNGTLDHSPEGGAGAPLESPAFTGIPTAPTAAPGTNTTQIATTGFVKAAIDVALAIVAGVTDAISAALSAHAARTDNPHSVTKAQVGLANADNTADTAKPVSTAQQTALDLKAPLASPTFTGTVAGITKSMVGLGSVDNTTDAAKLAAARLGTATNDNAAAGNIGELIEATLTSGSATALVNATPKTVISIALTAGDWDVSATAYFSPAAATSITLRKANISMVNNTEDTTPGRYVQATHPAQVPNGGNSMTVGPTRISLAAPATVYLVVNQAFTVDTLAAFGNIRARRVR